MQIFLYQNEQQVGPYTEDQIRAMVESGAISETDPGWQDGMADWQPLNAFLHFHAPAPILAPPTAPLQANSRDQVLQTNVRQGAIIGGFVCFVLGVVLMYLSMWSFFFYGPLFLVAFILSIVAMAQRRILGGISLLLATLIVPTVLGLLLFTTRTAKLATKLDASMQSPGAVTAPTVTSAPVDTTVAPANPDTTTATAQSTPMIAPAADSSQPAVGAPEATPADTPAPPKYPALDAKNGFRNFILGSPFSAFASTKLEDADVNIPDEKLYDVQDFDKTLGNAELAGIRLGFSQGLLKEIIVFVEGESNEAGLKAALTAAYGQPDTHSSFSGDELVWEGDKVKLVVGSGMSYTATFTNKDVDAQIEQIIQQKANAGAAAGAKGL